MTRLIAFLASFARDSVDNCGTAQMEAEMVAEGAGCVAAVRCGDCGLAAYLHQLCVGHLWRALELVSYSFQPAATRNLADLAPAQRIL